MVFEEVWCVIICLVFKMADKCSKCKASVLQNEGIKCTDCTVVCHIKCVGVVTRNKRWKCESCASECSSGSSKVSESERDSASTSILEAIAAFRKESCAKWDVNNEKLDKLQRDLNGIKAEMRTLNLRVDEVSLKCDQAGNNVIRLEAENLRLQESVCKLTVQVQDLEQHTRKNNLTISGVPLTKQENVLAVLASIARALKIKFYDGEVSAAHRLPGRKEDSRPPSIVVSFISRQVKTIWLTARKNHGSLTAQELHRSFPDTRIYLNEHLAPATRGVFNAARALKKEGKLSAVWTQDCKVMAKVTPEQRPFRIIDMDHVGQLGRITSSPPREQDSQPHASTVTTPKPPEKDPKINVPSPLLK